MPRSPVFPASGFREEGLALNTLFVFTLTAHGNGMTYLTGSHGKATHRDLLCSILLPGSVRKPRLFSHWATSSTLASVIIKVVLWLSAIPLSFYQCVQNLDAEEGRCFLECSSESQHSDLGES